MEKVSSEAGDLIELKLQPETAVWLRELLNTLELKAGIPLEHARKLLAYKDEVAGQLPAPTMNGQEKE